jgi:hypothetical protein
MNALTMAQPAGMMPMQYGMEPQAEPEREYNLWDLAKKVRSFEDSEEATDTARQQSERCRDYYDGKQLTAQELAVLAQRGQPDVIINRIQSKVNYLLGYEATLRTDPKGRPRTPEDEEAADACSDALNYVRDTSDQPQAFSQCWENMLIEGVGGSEVTPTLKQGDADIKIKKVHWDRAFWDLHSREHDFSDARYLGQVVWMDEEDALAQWPTPEAAEAIAKTISDEARFTYQDRPRWRQWATSGTHRKRVRIVQMYYKCRSKDGKDECWHWCIFTSGGEIEAGQVPYRDDDEVSLCPLVLESAYIDRENNRYGFVLALLGPQDEINKRRSKMLHEANVRQFRYEKGAVDDVDITKQELSKPDGGVETNPGFEFELIDRSKEIAAHAALQSEAKQEIELMGPNAAMLGQQGGDPSGRAILANQSGGQMEIGLLVDRHNHYKKRVHQLIWSMIKLYWTEEKWVRVTDDDDNVKFVGFNRPVTLAEVLLEQAKKEGVPEDEAKAKLREAAQDPMLAQQLQEVVKMEHVPSDMGMDIILDEIPDTANIQQEQFKDIADLAKAGVPFPPKVLIKASSLRNKKELLDELEKEQEDPAAQAAQKIQMEGAIAEIEKLKAENEKTRAETSAKLAEIDKTLAEIGKIKAESIERLARADTYDLQIGQITDPQITGNGAGNQISRPAPQSGAQTPAPSGPPTVPMPDYEPELPAQAYEFGEEEAPLLPQPPMPQPFSPPQQAGF